MKKQSISILSILFILFSCSDDSPEPTTDLIGKWKLVEVLNDPGDGSGVFGKVNSEKHLIFGYNEMVTSNGDMFSNSTEIGVSTTAIYSLDDSTIMKSATSTPFEKLYFQLEKGQLTMGNFGCIEACSAKFTKVK
jgi:hypothetical protein